MHEVRFLSPERAKFEGNRTEIKLRHEFQLDGFMIRSAAWENPSKRKELEERAGLLVESPGPPCGRTLAQTPPSNRRAIQKGRLSTKKLRNKHSKTEGPGPWGHIQGD